jgi:PAS domain S-box-containing protein
MEKPLKTPALALMQRAMEHAVEGASTLDPDGRYTYVNQRYAEIAGRSPGEMIGRTWDMTVHPDDLPMLQDAYAEMCKTGKVVREARGLTPEGEVFHKRVTMIADYAEDGCLSGHFCFAQDITRHRKVSEQYRRKTDWLGLTETVGKIGHWFVDLKADTVYWSDEVYRIHGRDRADYTPTLAEGIEAYHPEDREFVAACVQRSIDESEQFDFERRIVRPNGTIRWIATRGDCRQDPEGNPAAIFGIFQDITEERESELFRERVWHLLMDQSLDHTAKIDRVLADATAYFRMEFGVLAEVKGDCYTVKYSDCPDNEIEPGTRFDITNTYCWHVLQADAPRYFHHVADSEICDHPCYQEFGLESYIGTPLIVNGSRYGTLNFSSSQPRQEPFTRRDREIIELVATWLGNELGRQFVLSELSISQERLALAVSGSGVGISDWQDLSQDAQFWSDQHYRLLGYRPGEGAASASRFLAHIHPDDRDDVTAVIRHHFATGAPYEKEARIRLKDGSYRWFLGTGQAVWDDNGKPVRLIGTILDIEERKRAETTKSEFVSTVSHELRTPLTSIMGVLGLVRSGRYGELSEKASQLLDIAQSSGDRLARLINDLLDIEKLESGNVELSRWRQPASPLIEQAVREFCADPKRASITVSFDDASDMAEINADSDRFIQVLTNLLSNAAKFSPAGGEIEVRASVEGDQIRVTVADDGPGIPDDHFARIFDRFTQVDASDTRAKGGTGLGLAISKAIVLAHGGTIGVSNRPEGGACFEIVLSRVMASSEVIDIIEVGLPALPRILYVEDDADTANLLRHALADSAEVVIAGSRRQADSLLCESEYDLILLDLKLPDQTGQTLLDHIAASPGKAPPVIVYSVLEFEPREEWPFVRGAYVKSKIGLEELKSCIVSELVISSGSRESAGGQA